MAGKIKFSSFQNLRCPDWEEARQKSCTALLQAGTEGIRLLICSNETGRILALDDIRYSMEMPEDEHLDQFRQFIPDSVLSQAAISSLQLIADWPGFSLLPADLFSRETGEEALRKLASWKYPVQVYHQEAGAQKWISFGVPQVWEDWLNQVFSGSERGVSSMAGSLLKYQEKQAAQSDEPLVFAQIGTERMFLSVFVEKELQLANHFLYKTENDLLYFLLLGLEQNQLDPALTRIQLSGGIMPGSAGYEKLNRYAGNLQFEAWKPADPVFSSFDLLHHPLYADLMAHYDQQFLTQFV